ncbi:response regulator transcription factor [Larkinella harenae]
MSSSTTSVLIVEDHPIMLRAIADLVKSLDSTIEVICSSSVEDAKIRLSQRDFFLLISDIQLKEDRKAGIQLLLAAQSINQRIKSLIYTQFDDAETIRSCMLVSINGYVTKNESENQLRTAISQLLSGEDYFSPLIVRILTKLEKNRQQPDEQPNPIKALTRHELEVIRLIGLDLPKKEIAIRLGLSPAAIYSQTQKIAEKLDVKGDVGIALFAHKHQLL